MKHTIKFSIPDDETWQSLDDYAWVKGHKTISGLCLFALFQCMERNALKPAQKARIALRHGQA